MKSAIGCVLVFLSIMVLSLVIHNTIYMFDVWIVGADHEIEYRMTASDYVDTSMHAGLRLLLACGMFWGGRRLFNEWRTISWIALLLIGFLLLLGRLNLPPQYVGGPTISVTITGFLLMLLGVAVPIANRLKTKSDQPISEEA